MTSIPISPPSCGTFRFTFCNCSSIFKFDFSCLPCFTFKLDLTYLEASPSTLITNLFM